MRPAVSAEHHEIAALDSAILRAQDFSRAQYEGCHRRKSAKTTCPFPRLLLQTQKTSSSPTFAYPPIYRTDSVQPPAPPKTYRAHFLPPCRRHGQSSNQ